ncbi:MAG: hypothetical protein HYU03_04225, partial [Thaumarchaeota archaeon]|nr:hypothetical protein [Nitrososphaerota archaeon]
KHNPFWQALAGWNQELLNEFVDARFARAKERFGYPDDSMMGVSVPPIPEKGTLGHAWCISGLMEYSGRADYGSGLGSPYGRLIGVAESRGKRNIPLSSPIGWHSTLENLVLENTRLPNRRFVF